MSNQSKFLHIEDFCPIYEEKATSFVSLNQKCLALMEKPVNFSTVWWRNSPPTSRARVAGPPKGRRGVVRSEESIAAGFTRRTLLGWHPCSVTLLAEQVGGFGAVVDYVMGGGMRLPLVTLPDFVTPCHVIFL
jgi:hypothetical protein